jgi:hypothetical protein
MPTVDEYLAQLIPPPNNQQPKFLDWLNQNLKLIVDAQNVINSIGPSFYIANGVGAQLDRIGEILGLPRVLNFTPQGGVSPVMEDSIYRIALQAKILQNRWKGTKQEIYDFWTAYFPLYPILIQDNQDMTMTVYVLNVPNDNDNLLFFGYGPETGNIRGYGTGYWVGFTGGLFQEIVKAGYFTPKPAGVRTNYVFTNKEIFAYGVDTGYLSGYGTGVWSAL